MNQTIYFLLLLLLTVSVNSSCTSNKLMDWRKMECGLYMSPNGDIGFATIPEQANNHNYQLKEDECPNSFLTTFDYDDTTHLKYVVDTSTFEHIGSVFYKDTNNIYSYYPMCDGGYFNVLSNDVSKFKWLDGYYFILNSNIEYFNKGEINANYNTFKVSQKHTQLACDKDFFYSFGEKMTLEEFEKSNSEEVVEELLHLQDFIDELIIDTDTLFFFK